MTLLFTSLFSTGAMPAPPEPPEPDFPWTTNLLYRFSASEGVYKDDVSTPAAHGDGVARWVNLGAAEDAVQPVAARRPTYRTGGFAGRPYIACDRALVQHFRGPGVAAAGRNAAGTTASPYARFWLRQNRAGVWEARPATASVTAKTVNWSRVVTPEGWVRAPRAPSGQRRHHRTQFLRATGLATGGYFHGHLYEILLYDGTLDDETTFAIEDWMAARYGLA